MCFSFSHRNMPALGACHSAYLDKCFSASRHVVSEYLSHVIFLHALRLAQLQTQQHGPQETCLQNKSRQRVMHKLAGSQQSRQCKGHLTLSEKACAVISTCQSKQTCSFLHNGSPLLVVHLHLLQMLHKAIWAPCGQHFSNHDLCETAGTNGAGMQAEANLLKHVRVTCGPA